jgi:hypothetical protein
MPLETTELKQKAVLWEVAGHDNAGKVTLEAAVEINVRRELRRQESLAPNNTAIAIDATYVVDREISVDAIIWFGALADWSSSSTGYKQVIDYDEIPDMKARHYRRLIKVIKYHDTLPSLAS